MADHDLLLLGHILDGGIESWRKLAEDQIRERHFEGRGAAIYAWIADTIDSGAVYPDRQSAAARFELTWPEDPAFRFRDLVGHIRERRQGRIMEEAVTGATDALKRGERGRARSLLRDAERRMELEESPEIEVRSLTALAPVVKARYELTASGRGGVALPWPSVNRMIGRLQPKSVLGLIASPGTGKTTVSLDASTYAWKIDGHVILYVTPEMAAEDLAESFFSLAGNIPFSKMVLGELTDEHKTRLWTTCDDLEAQTGLYVLDSEDGLTPDRIESAIRKIQPTLIVVDSFYELFADMKGHHEMTVRLDYTTAWLKRIACMNGGIPVIANSQLKGGVGDGASAGGDEIGMSQRIRQRFQAVFKLWRQEPDDIRDGVIRIGPLKIRRMGEWKKQVLLSWDKTQGRLIEVEPPKAFKDSFDF